MYSIHEIDTDKLDTSFLEGVKKIFKGKKIEIVIHDVVEDTINLEKPIQKNKSAQGLFNKYSNRSLLEKEQDAWGEAIKEKHRVG